MCLLYTFSDKTHYFSPKHLSQQLKMRYHLLHHYSVLGKYSHVGTSDYGRYLRFIKESLDANVVFDLTELKDHDWTPVHSKPVIIPTEVVSEGNSLRYLSQWGVRHHAIISISP